MARPTPQLQTTIEQYQAILAPDQFAELIANIESIFSKFTAKLLEFEPGLQRGTALHQMMDRELKAASQFPTSCHRGCSGCCHYEVEITRNEAIVLCDAVKRGVEIDHERLHLQASRERRSPEWKRFGSTDNRCVFLAADGACRVYDIRPSICRKHMVSTPAANCSKDGAMVAPIQVLLAEILLSAELSISENEFGSLSKMLEPLLHQQSAPR
jgi:Fe-S-cluster containining protein